MKAFLSGTAIFILIFILCYSSKNIGVWHSIVAGFPTALAVYIGYKLNIFSEINKNWGKSKFFPIMVYALLFFFPTLITSISVIKNNERLDFVLYCYVSGVYVAGIIFGAALVKLKYSQES